MAISFLKLWSNISRYVSFEFILTKTRQPNGGDIILLRAFLSSLLLFIGAIAAKNALDPAFVWVLSGRTFMQEISQHIPWFGATFAGIYALLYARFSSQWTYLANLYNQIKAAEARAAEKEMHDEQNIISAWKAGFIEDAEELHLATKGLFASVIMDWGSKEEVKAQYTRNTPGGEERFNSVMAAVKTVYELQEKRYHK